LKPPEEVGIHRREFKPDCAFTEQGSAGVLPPAQRTSARSRVGVEDALFQFEQCR
jgi:hypothetical protein